MGQVYSFTTPFVSVSAGDTVLVEYRTPSNRSAIVHFIEVTQNSNDSTSDQVPMSVNRGAPALAGTGVTGYALNTTGATPAGSASYGGTKATTPENLGNTAFNVLAGQQRLPTPEIRYEMRGGETIEVLLTAAPATATSFSARIEVEEIG